MKTHQDIVALDAADPLRSLRSLFNLPASVIYLDGNSLGALPSAAPARIAQVVNQEWGQDLIRSWNTAGWINSPHAVGDKIARLIGAGRGEVVATDSTSINLFKVLNTAILIAAHAHSICARGQKSNEKPLRKVVSERSNFPTDLYIAEALCAQHGLQLELVDAPDLPAAINSDCAVLMLTHVNYRTGALHDIAALTAQAHAAGALAVWDLAHSTGGVPVDLHAADADFAVGCGYKYLNGGPGAPAFLWVHPRHLHTMDAATAQGDKSFMQPLAGWWGHAAPFAFTPDYQAGKGIARYLCGTQPILNMAALDCALDVFAQADALGGMPALRRKSLALTDCFMQLAQERCAAWRIACITPQAHAQRGSQVSLYCDDAAGKPGPAAAFGIVQALIARGVIGDYRSGDDTASLPNDRLHIMRFGFAPLYNTFEDVWQAVEHLHQVLKSEEWREPRFNQRSAVT